MRGGKRTEGLTPREMSAQRPEGSGARSRPIEEAELRRERVGT